MWFLRTGFPLLFSWLALMVTVVGSPVANAYPLDGYDDTGIVRLEAYRIAQQNSDGAVLPFGAMLATRSIGLSLTDYPEFAIPPIDEEFSADLIEVLGTDAGGYGVAVLDLTDPEQQQGCAVTRPIATTAATATGGSNQSEMSRRQLVQLSFVS